jgi:hypothetical protein
MWQCNTELRECVHSMGFFVGLTRSVLRVFPMTGVFRFWEQQGYFLTTGKGNGKRVTASSPCNCVSSMKAQIKLESESYQSHNNNNNNLTNQFRRWLWQAFKSLSQACVFISSFFMISIHVGMHYRTGRPCHWRSFVDPFGQSHSARRSDVTPAFCFVKFQTGVCGLMRPWLREISYSQECGYQPGLKQSGGPIQSKQLSILARQLRSVAGR